VPGGTVHLSRQADPHNLAGVDTPDDFAHGLLGTLPPVSRILFAPEGLRRREWVFG